MLCRGLLYVVCWYVGVLPLKVGSCGRSRPQDVDFALRRSCLVVKITMYMHTCAPFSLSSLFVTHDFYRACTAGFPTSCSPGELPSRSAHGPPYAGEPLPWCRGNSPRGHPNSLPRCTPPPPSLYLNLRPPPPRPGEGGPFYGDRVKLL